MVAAFLIARGGFQRVWVQAMGGEAAAHCVQIGGGRGDKPLLAFGGDLIGDGFKRLAIGQDDVACAALIGARRAFLLVERLPAGLGHFQHHAFNETTETRLEIQYTAAAAAAEKIKGEPRIGQEAGADWADRCRVMAMARAPIAPILFVGIRTIGEAVARDHDWLAEG
jgi:hypothetical protein